MHMSTYSIRVASLDGFTSIHIIDIFQLSVLLGSRSVAVLKRVAEGSVVLQVGVLRDDLNVLVLVISRLLLGQSQRNKCIRD